MKSWFAVFLAMSLMAAIGWSTNDVSPIANPKIRRIQTNQGDSSLVGQFQTSASGWLWNYTEVYLHNGVKFRKLSEAEKREVEQGNIQKVQTTIIPTAEKDFRGVFGDVDRAVNAWTPDMQYKQNDPRQCMPLFRLMTWLDPQFVEGWTNGAMVIGMGYTKEATQKAKEFLREGYRANPDCVDIPTMFGMFEVTRDKDYVKAERFFRQAVNNGRARFEVLSETERNALQGAYRWLALVYRNTGQFRKLKKTVTEGMHLFPDDLVMPSTSRPSVLPPTRYKAPTGITVRQIS